MLAQVYICLHRYARMSDEDLSSPALEALKRCRMNLRLARIEAADAAARLTGARATRA